jgi:hypothetical protein
MLREFDERLGADEPERRDCEIEDKKSSAKFVYKYKWAVVTAEGSKSIIIGKKRRGENWKSRGVMTGLFPHGGDGLVKLYRQFGLVK